MRRKILLAKPWLGEFGWELFGWHAHLRWLAKNTNYEYIIAGVRSGHEVLYQDFVTHYLYDNRKGDSKGPNFNYKSPEFTPAAKSKIERSFGGFINHDVDTIQPTIKLCHKISVEHKYQTFLPFGQKVKTQGYDVIIHARHIGDHCNTLNGDWRNYPLDKWVQIIEQLKNKNLSIAMVGTKDKTYDIQDIKDLRNIPLKELVGIFANSKVVTGPSSGPLHLASLCKCPQVVWTDNLKNLHNIFTNRQRYTKLWNPFNTSVEVIDDQGWSPKPNDVCNKIFQILDKS